MFVFTNPVLICHVAQCFWQWYFSYLNWHFISWATVCVLSGIVETMKVSSSLCSMNVPVIFGYNLHVYCTIVYALPVPFYFSPPSVLHLFFMCVSFQPNFMPVLLPTLFMSCLCCFFFRRLRMSPTCRRRTKRLENCSSHREPPSCPSSCQCLIQFLHGVRLLYFIYYFPFPSASWDTQVMVVVMVDCCCSVDIASWLLRHSTISYWSML